jgi:hypothetical protein
MGGVDIVRLDRPIPRTPRQIAVSVNGLRVDVRPDVAKLEPHFRLNWDAWNEKIAQFRAVSVFPRSKGDDRRNVSATTLHQGQSFRDRYLNSHPRCFTRAAIRALAT